jgi:hypothetical protein
MKAKADQVYRNRDVEKLRAKLAEMKEKNDDLKANLDNGTDQVKEYCIELRNQVHLQTEILLEQVHQFNENLRAEIDKYEQQCIDSFGNKIVNKETEFSGFIKEINKFFDDKTKYLNEFLIDETAIGESLALADNYLMKLKKEDLALKKIKFDGKLMQFKKNENKLDNSLLGSLVNKQLCYGFENMKEVKFPQQLDIFAVSSQKTQPTSQVFQNLIQHPPASMGRGRGSRFAAAAIRC